MWLRNRNQVYFVSLWLIWGNMERFTKITSTVRHELFSRPFPFKGKYFPILTISWWNKLCIIFLLNILSTNATWTSDLKKKGSSSRFSGENIHGEREIFPSTLNYISLPIRFLKVDTWNILYLLLNRYFVLWYNPKCAADDLTLYHTVLTFYDPENKVFWKHCGKRRKCW